MWATVSAVEPKPCQRTPSWSQCQQHCKSVSTVGQSFVIAATAVLEELQVTDANVWYRFAEGTGGSEGFRVPDRCPRIRGAYAD